MTFLSSSSALVVSESSDIPSIEVVQESEQQDLILSERQNNGNYQHTNQDEAIAQKMTDEDVFLSELSYMDDDLQPIRSVWDLYRKRAFHEKRLPLLRLTDEILSNSRFIRFLVDRVEKLEVSARPTSVMLDVGNDEYANDIEDALHSSDAAHAIRHWIQFFRLCQGSLKSLTLCNGSSDYRSYLYDSLLRILPFLEKLTTLELCHVTVSPFASQMLALIFESKQCQIRSLHLVDVDVEDMGDFALSLKSYSGLKALTYNNQFGENHQPQAQAEDANLILDALTETTSRLTSLDLKDAHLSEASLLPMIKVLEAQTELLCLDLSYNAFFFSKKHTQHFVLETILKHPSLETLLMNCCFNASQISFVYGALAESQHQLQKLELDSTDSVMERNRSFGSYTSSL